MAKANLTAARLRELLEYNPETGEFKWLKRVSMRVLAGAIAGGPSNADGRWRITVDGSKYLAHRLAWLHFYGEWPNGQVDHIHGDGHMGNNRIADLRPVTPQINTQNQRHARSDNENSDLIGAHWDKRWSRWRSCIGISGKQIHLGTFSSKEAAHAAYVEAKRRLHPGCTI